MHDLKEEEPPQHAKRLMFDLKEEEPPQHARRLMSDLKRRGATSTRETADV